MTEGLLLVQKPAGVTSHDVVEVVRRKLGVQRVGHAGTLDPMAEGLLVVLVGAATKSQRAFQQHEKSYEATIRFGAQTDTADATGAIIAQAPVPVLDAQRIATVLASFEGPLSQTPPAFSAVKVRGRPAYWWARRRQPVVLPPRLVQIHALSLQRLERDTLTIRVQCSAGTYIRTLAEVIAKALGTVGHLTSLTRLSVGAWRLEQAVPLAWIADATPQILCERLMPVTVCSSSRS